MEDAHITTSPLTDKNNSLFAVFDGHGGIFWLIQAHKYLLLWRGTSSVNFKETKIISQRIMKRHSEKHSC